MLSFKTIFCIILLTESLTIAPCTAVCDGLNHSATFGHRKQGDQVQYATKIALNPPATTLTAFFTLCQNDAFTKTLLHSEMPTYYTWNASRKVERRKRGEQVDGQPGILKETMIGRPYIPIKMNASFLNKPGPTSSNNSEFGQALVSQEQVVASWKFLWCTSREVMYPLRGQDQLEITYIEIIDNYSNGYGGCPYIVEGGVGNKFVKIYIKSQFNRGFDFEIKIYGIQP